MKFMETMVINLDRNIHRCEYDETKYEFNGPPSLTITTAIELTSEEIWICSEIYNMPINCIIFKIDKGI